MYALLFIHSCEIFRVFGVKFRYIVFIGVGYNRGIKLIYNFVYDGYIFEILISIISMCIFRILT